MTLEDTQVTDKLANLPTDPFQGCLAPNEGSHANQRRENVPSSHCAVARRDAIQQRGEVNKGNY